MRNNPFEGQLERLARTLTDQFGVQVVCQGDEAWTDGKQIMLPSLPEPLDEPLERMILGYLDHEMAHVAFSDFGVVKEFSENHPGHEAMLNVVEDALIEQRAMRRWPGVRANLDAMFAQIRDRIVALAAQRDAFGRFCTAVYLKLAHYRDMLGLDAEVVAYEDVLDGFATVRTTNDSASLAERLLVRWLQDHPVADCAEEPSSGSAGKTEESQPTEGDGTGTDKTPGTSSAESPHSGNGRGEEQSSQERQRKESQTEPDAEGQPDPDHNKVSANAQSADSDKQSAESPSTPNGIASPHGAGGTSVVTQALAEAIAEHVAALSGGNEYRVYTRQFDRVDVVPVANEHDVRELMMKHADVVRRLRRGLANALRSAEKRWWRDDQLRGALSPRSLHRLCLDRPQLDVFRTRSTVQGQSTAVSIVLDASGSMTINKMDVARDALRVLLEALDDLTVATEAITFTTGNGTSVATLAARRNEDPNELRQRFSRISNLEIGVVKQFGEPVKAALRRLPTIKGTGLTPLGEAMLIGARRLAPRRETRRIMLVLTDGRAGCESNDGAAVKHAEHVAIQIESAGIELIGVGILDDSLRATVTDTIVVQTLEELPAQLCKLLGRTLTRGLRNVG